MKREEAIEVIKSNYPTENYRLLREALDMSIEALEEPKAKKPRYFTDMYGHNRPGCPGCSRSEILYAGQKFCSVCGTKIDWGKDE